MIVFMCYPYKYLREQDSHPLSGGFCIVDAKQIIAHNYLVFKVNIQGDIFMASITKCIACGSVAYGPSCPFSVHKRHFHANNAKTCCWCGSSALGPGCPFNPFGHNHIRGVDFNQMMGDSVENGIVLGYLMKNLSAPYTESRAYALKLIDENGTILRKPETDEEKAAFTILDE